MIIVKIELHSAATGEVTEIGRLAIANEGTGSKVRGNYRVNLFRRKVFKVPLVLPHDARGHARGFTVQRYGAVNGHARLSASVWQLVKKALAAVGV